ncbi:MAG: class II fructose-bisphosphate aldolase [Candidatus Daviesbacteria bacterium]|nr:class II fructose-bisphosphate aldolase [Candidatus Daviesbacteria bacterium]
MTAREWFQKAKKEKFAIGAFNVGNLETFKAIIQAGANKKSPIIIETSPGETDWLGEDNIIDLAKNYSQDYGVPVLVNLDHAGSLAECVLAIEAGFDLIHFDGSKLPLEDNIKIAKEVVELAHQKGILVEGEMDHISGSSEVHQGSAESEIKNIPMTDPEKATQFVTETGIDILAAFFGNVHGVFSEGGENLDLEVLKKIAEKLPDTYFSLHGGSGISENHVKKAIQNGIVKVNINTEMRQAFRKEMMEVLANNPDEIAMYKIEKPVVAKITEIVENKIGVFGSEGKIYG